VRAFRKRPEATGGVAVDKVISMVGYRELTLGAVAEYARSMQAENGPSEVRARLRMRQQHNP
jgi:hypothetical protein